MSFTWKIIQLASVKYLNLVCPSEVLNDIAMAIRPNDVLNDAAMTTVLEKRRMKNEHTIKIINQLNEGVPGIWEWPIEHIIYYFYTSTCLTPILK